MEEDHERPHIVEENRQETYGGEKEDRQIYGNCQRDPQTEVGITRGIEVGTRNRGDDPRGSKENNTKGRNQTVFTGKLGVLKEHAK